MTHRHLGSKPFRASNRHAQWLGTLSAINPFIKVGKTLKRRTSFYPLTDKNKGILKRRNMPFTEISFWLPGEDV